MAQYSYGKLAPSHVRDEEVILGSDMPLIEYRRTIDPVYGKVLKDILDEENGIAEELRPRPYPLLENHFEYAWAQAQPYQPQPKTATAGDTVSS